MRKSSARILLLAHQHPTWCNAEIARRVGCCVNTVKHWRQRWQQTASVHDAPRAGTRRTFTPLQRAQITPPACRAPRTHGQPWPRWSGEKLAQVAIEQQIVEHIAPGTIRPWLRRSGTPSTSRIGINGWARCNCAVRCWWRRA